MTTLSRTALATARTGIIKTNNAGLIDANALNSYLLQLEAAVFNLNDDNMQSGAALLASGQALTSGLATQSALSAVANAIPAPAAAPPPGIGVSGAVGTQTNAYALANHTHASSVQRARFPLVAGGTYTWTFPVAYAAGAVPVVTHGIENTTGATQPIVVNMLGTPSNTSVTFKAFQAGTVTVSLLGTNVNVFSAAATGTYLHVWAAMATQ